MRSRLHPKYREEQIEAHLERIAEALEDDAELEHVLKLVPDAATRPLVRERMKPYLKFTPKEK